MGGYFINYFNRFGRTWQIYVEAEGDYRTDPKNVGQFYVRNANNDPVPLDSVATIKNDYRTGVHYALQRISLRANKWRRCARL